MQEITTARKPRMKGGVIGRGGEGEDGPRREGEEAGRRDRRTRLPPFERASTHKVKHDAQNAELPHPTKEGGIEILPPFAEVVVERVVGTVRAVVETVAECARLYASTHRTARRNQTEQRRRQRKETESAQHNTRKDGERTSGTLESSAHHFLPELSKSRWRIMRSVRTASAQEVPEHRDRGEQMTRKEESYFARGPVIVMRRRHGVIVVFFNHEPKFNTAGVPMYLSTQYKPLYPGDGLHAVSPNSSSFWKALRFDSARGMYSYTADFESFFTLLLQFCICSVNYEQPPNDKFDRSSLHLIHAAVGGTSLRIPGIAFTMLWLRIWPKYLEQLTGRHRSSTPPEAWHCTRAAWFFVWCTRALSMTVFIGINSAATSDLVRNASPKNSLIPTSNFQLQTNFPATVLGNFPTSSCPHTVFVARSTSRHRHQFPSLPINTRPLPHTTSSEYMFLFLPDWQISQDPTV
ncbi:hypothetical protein C8R45DRAFT_1076549 [Mycena sanguinolenta]|nr:hypothetical protein C8R45DRAFT_1076549 [Mycena sanguinolenta]